MRLRLLGLAALALLAASCGGPATPTPPSPQDILGRAGQAMARLDSFHFKMSHEGGGTPIMEGLTLEEVEGDVVRPGRMRATLGATYQVQSGKMYITLEIITVGDTTYMSSLVPGRWEALPSSVSPAGFFDPDAGMGGILASLEGLARLRDGDIAGVASYRLAGRVSSEVLRPVVGFPVPGEVIQAEVWVGRDDFLVRRLRLQGRVVEGDREGISRIIEVSRFNQPVAIEPPAP